MSNYENFLWSGVLKIQKIESPKRKIQIQNFSLSLLKNSKCMQYRACTLHAYTIKHVLRVQRAFQTLALYKNCMRADRASAFIIYYSNMCNVQT